MQHIQCMCCTSTAERNNFSKENATQAMHMPYLTAGKTVLEEIAKQAMHMLYLMAEVKCWPDREGRMSRGLSMGSTSLAAISNPYCLLMASPNPSTHMTVDAVWSTDDTCIHNTVDAVWSTAGTCTHIIVTLQGPQLTRHLCTQHCYAVWSTAGTYRHNPVDVVGFTDDTYIHTTVDVVWSTAETSHVYKTLVMLCGPSLAPAHTSRQMLCGP